MNSRAPWGWRCFFILDSAFEDLHLNLIRVKWGSPCYIVFNAKWNCVFCSSDWKIHCNTFNHSLYRKESVFIREYVPSLCSIFLFIVLLPCSLHRKMKTGVLNAEMLMCLARGMWHKLSRALPSDWPYGHFPHKLLIVKCKYSNIIYFCRSRILQDWI